MNNLVFTGGNDNFLKSIKNEFMYANNEINIIVAFIKNSGINLLLEDIKNTTNKGVKVRILTGTYLGITDVSALFILLNEMDKNPNLEVKLFANQNISFHPKSYMFINKENSCIYIGSSNMSKTAFTIGVEWNTKVIDLKTCELFIEDFNVEYEKGLYLNFDLIDQYEQKIEFNKIKKEKNETLQEDEVFLPNSVQSKILYKLDKTRSEGNDKGIVIAATGIGKTYLAAFDTLKFKKILFIAHTDSILVQAEKSFKAIHKKKSTGFITGNKKEINADISFSTIQTLSRDYSQFKVDHFDYIIVDEFHHAASASYLKVIDYFYPKFLLGLTATPERLDNKDVFALCDYNIVYELRLAEAIKKAYLVPFRYYGIYDKTDYTKIKTTQNKYNENELLKCYTESGRTQLIVDNYLKYGSEHAIAFCYSKNHALSMCEKFNENGIKSIVSFSGHDTSDYFVEKNEAIFMLDNSLVKVIFTVNLFNEGVDIPKVDMLLMLRPTQSSTIFLQQIGRGLRKHVDKNYVTILDFVGNYIDVEKLPLIFGVDEYDKQLSLRNIAEVLPPSCIVDLDLEIIKEINKINSVTTSNVINHDLLYKKLSELDNNELFETHPSRHDVSLVSTDLEIEYMMNKKNVPSPLVSMYKYYYDKNMIKAEKLDDKLVMFLEFIELTKMNKLYKMALLKAMYNEGNLKLKISLDELITYFKLFYSDKTHYKDLKTNVDVENYKFKEVIVSGPIKALCKNEEFFEYDKNSKVFKLMLPPEKINNIFMIHFIDIINYRREVFIRGKRYNE